MKNTKDSSRVVLLLKATVALGLITLLLYRVDWLLMYQSATDINWNLLLLAFLSFILIAALEVERLGAALKSFGLSRAKLWRLHVVGAFVGSIFPGQIGADAYKALAIGSKEKGFTRPITLIVALRLLGFVILLMAAILSCVSSWDNIKTHSESISLTLPAWFCHNNFLILLSFALVLFACFLFLRVRKSPRIQEAFLTVSQLRGKTLLVLIFLSCLIVVARTLVFFFLCCSVGIFLSPMEAVFVICSATVLTLLPISLAGLGVREGSIAGLLLILNAGYEQSLSVALLGRVFIVLTALCGGLWLLCSRQAKSRI